MQHPRGQASSAAAKLVFEGAEATGHWLLQYCVIHNDVIVDSVLSRFIDLPNPSDPCGHRHTLSSLAAITLLAVLSRTNRSSSIRQYALGNQVWLSSFLKLPHGIPNADTLELTIRLVNPGTWYEYFYRWTRTLALA